MGFQRPFEHLQIERCRKIGHECRKADDCFIRHLLKNKPSVNIEFPDVELLVQIKFVDFHRLVELCRQCIGGDVNIIFYPENVHPKCQVALCYKCGDFSGFDLTHVIVPPEVIRKIMTVEIRCGMIVKVESKMESGFIRFFFQNIQYGGSPERKTL